MAETELGQSQELWARSRSSTQESGTYSSINAASQGPHQQEAEVGAGCWTQASHLGHNHRVKHLSPVSDSERIDNSVLLDTELCGDLIRVCMQKMYNIVAGNREKGGILRSWEDFTSSPPVFSLCHHPSASGVFQSYVLIFCTCFWNYKTLLDVSPNLQHILI